MLLTRIVQLVFIMGIGSVTVLGVRVLLQDIREHRADRLTIPVDYDGSLRRKIMVIRDEEGRVVRPRD